MSAIRLKRGAAPALLAVAGLAATIALSGCTDILNALFDTASPTGVHASDGEYANSIEVSWGAPNISSDKWKGYSILGYKVEWTGPTPGFSFPSGTSHSISVSAGDRGQEYSITVTTLLTSGSLSGGSASDTGFALDTKDLLWYDSGHPYPGVDQWYVTMLQKGFKYTFDFGLGETGQIEVCTYKTLDRVLLPTTPIRAPVWTCDSNGAGNKFFIHVMPSGTTTVTASYSF